MDNDQLDGGITLKRWYKHQTPKDVIRSILIYLLLSHIRVAWLINVGSRSDGWIYWKSLLQLIITVHTLNSFLIMNLWLYFFWFLDCSLVFYYSQGNGPIRHVKTCPDFFFTARVHTTKSTVKILAANTYCKYFVKIAEVTRFFCTRNRLYQRFVQPLLALTHSRDITARAWPWVIRMNGSASLYSRI
jgi:hypothetical protein